MNAITKPIITALDTSVLGDASRDMNSTDPAIRIRGTDFRKGLFEIGVVPVISFHHLEELLGHADLKVARDRFGYLRSLPVVACVNCCRLPGWFGSIVDVLAYEVEAACRQPNFSILEIREQVRTRIFRYCSGEEAMRGIEDWWEWLRPKFAEHMRHSREIVAVARANHIDVANRLVSDFLTEPLNTAEETAQAFTYLLRGLHEQISTRGDKRITDAAAVAYQFMAEVASSEPDVGSSPDGRLAFLAKHEIYADDLKAGMRMSDMTDLAIFRGQLKIVCEIIGVQWDSLRQAVNINRLPSAALGRALRRYGQDLPERKGSDMADGHMAALSLYADLSYVDRRTNENLTRAARADNVIRDLVKHADKAGQYFDLPDRIRRASSAMSWA